MQFLLQGLSWYWKRGTYHEGRHVCPIFIKGIRIIIKYADMLMWWWLFFCNKKCFQKSEKHPWSLYHNPTWLVLKWKCKLWKYVKHFSQNGIIFNIILFVLYVIFCYSSSLIVSFFVHHLSKYHQMRWYRYSTSSIIKS